jgi:hypothetical protein
MRAMERANLLAKSETGIGQLMKGQPELLARLALLERAAGWRAHDAAPPHSGAPLSP